MPRKGSLEGADQIMLAAAIFFAILILIFFILIQEGYIRVAQQSIEISDKANTKGLGYTENIYGEKLTDGSVGCDKKWRCLVS